MDIYERKSLPEIEATNPTYDVVERVEYEGGIKIFLKGHKYPLYGMATIEAVQSINVVKKVLLGQFLRAAELAIEPHTLKPEYMHHASRELRRIFPGRIGQLVAWMIEYDAAYRMRFLDLMSESSHDALINKPIREIWRLLRINKRRDQKSVNTKFQYIAIVLSLVLLWPWARKNWKNSLSICNFEALQLDEIDKYWLSLRTDYNSSA